MSTASQTDLVHWAGVVADQLALTPPPDDTRVDITLTNYTGNADAPSLDVLYFSLGFRTQDGSYVDLFVRRIFGAKPANTETFRSDGRETTEWDGGDLRVRVWWTRTVVLAEVSA